MKRYKGIFESPEPPSDINVVWVDTSRSYPVIKVFGISGWVDVKNDTTALADQVVREALSVFSESLVQTTEQSLTDEQKSQARSNIGAAEDKDLMRVTDSPYTLEQQVQARNNISAASDFEAEGHTESVPGNGSDWASISVDVDSSKTYLVTIEGNLTDCTTEEQLSFLQILGTIDGERVIQWQTPKGETVKGLPVTVSGATQIQFYGRFLPEETAVLRIYEKDSILAQLSKKNPLLVEGDNIHIVSNPDGTQTISSEKGDDAVWGNIAGDIDDQTDLKEALAAKQNTLTDNDKQDIADLHKDKVTSVNGQTGEVVLDAEDVGAVPGTIEDVTDTEPVPDFPFVEYVEQSLTEDQKAQARKNIGVTSGGTVDVSWGNITGTLSEQSDLNEALESKQPVLSDDDKQAIADLHSDRVLSVNGKTGAVELSIPEEYDDTSIKERVSTIEGKESGWNAKADKSDIPSDEIAANTEARHTHTNKAVIDGISAEDVSSWNSKQDTVTDLETIRSGAALGATALQEVPDTYRTAEEQDAVHDDTKVDKEEGKGLSTNDFTDDYKDNLDVIIADYASAKTALTALQSKL